MKVSEPDGIRIGGKVPHQKYFIRELTPQTVIHNEALMGMLLANVAKYHGVGWTFLNIYQENMRVYDENGYYLGTLIEKLCNKAYQRQQVKDLDGFMHLLPIAYADYLTEYRTTSVEEFCGVFGGQLSRKWVDVYWNEIKEQIRTQVYAKPPIMSQKDFATIAELLKAIESDDTIEKDIE